MDHCADGSAYQNGWDSYSGCTTSDRDLSASTEYETASSLGSIMGIFNPDFTIESNFYCDTYGICTISWGTIMGFLMEYAPIKEWQADIIGILREEAYYFLPQRITKIICGFCRKS